MPNLLVAAALHEKPIPPRWLEHLNVSDDEVDRLLDAGQVTEVTRGFELADAAGASDVIKSTPWSARRRMRQALANACMKPPLDLESAGKHFEAAGNTTEAARAWLAAANAHCRRHRHRRAAPCFEKGLSLLPGETGDAEAVEAIQGLGQCAALAGEHARGISLLETWIKSPPWKSRPSVRAEGELVLAALYARDLRHVEAGFARQRAAADFLDLGRPAEAAAASNAAALTLTFALRYSSASESAIHAIKASRLAGDVQGEAAAGVVHGAALAMLGERKKARRVVEKALDLALAGRFTGIAAEAYRVLAVTNEYASRYREQQSSFTRAISYCRRHDEQETAGLCMGCFSWSYFRSGNWRKSEAMARDISTDPKMPVVSRAVANGVLGMLHAYRGETKQAVKTLNKCYAASLEYGVLAMELFCLGGLAVAAEAAGDAEEAASRYAALIDAWRVSEDRHDSILGLTHAAMFYASRNCSDETATCAEILDRLASLSGNPEAIGGAQFAAAELALLRGDPKKAINSLRKGLRAYEKLDLSIELILARMRLGVALKTVGKAEAAAPEFSEALARASRLGARPLAARVKAHRESAVGSEESQAGELWDLLSARQRDVARQLSRGLTNKEIAGELGISVRTVDMHVAHVLSRLDCRSRTEAAARIAEALR